MKNRHLIQQGATAVVLAAILGISTAQSAEVYLQAEEFQKSIPYGSTDGAPMHAVAIVNASFEEPDCSLPGCVIDAVRGNYFVGSLPGWTVTGSAGAFRPNATIIVPTDGVQVGWSNGGELVQVLAEELAPNTAYTLTVDVGDRTDSGFSSYVIGLYAGGTLLAEDNNSLAPVSGWETSTITYTSPASVAPGQALEIRLDGNGSQEEFDNVRLVAVSLAAQVTMWGYSECDDASFTTCGEPSSPGPQIDVAAGDPNLNITLRNTLPEATSIMIAGQANEPPGAAERVAGRLTSFTPSVDAAVGAAADVAVTNASFEEPDCSQPGCTVDAVRGNYFTGSIPGWTVTGSAGAFRPNASIIVPTDGAQVGWSNGGQLVQSLGEDLAADTTYTLTVDVGDRTDAGFAPYTIGLYAGGTLLAEDNNTLAPANGWLTSTVTYTSGASVVPGQVLEIRLSASGAQTEFDNVQLVRSTFSATMRTYSWSGLRPGTYLYQSGSHVQLQVQMGLYGALVQDAQGCGAPNCAYPDVAYDSAEVLVFSEIDPALHDPSPSAANASVDGYLPRFFLINGEPWTGVLPAASGSAGDDILLRLVNAGLDNRVAQMLGAYFEVLGQDGYRAPVSRMQHSVLLPAAKSIDLLFQPGEAGSYPLYDRRMKLVNGPVHGGGMLRPIVVD